MNVQPLDLTRLRVRPLSERDSLTRADEILLSPDDPPPPLDAPVAAAVARCAGKSRRRGPEGRAWC